MADVFAFIRSTDSFRRIHPQRITFARGTPPDGEIARDQTYDFHHWMGHVLPIPWRVQIVDFVDDVRFTDLQIHGPFRFFHHSHVCEPVEGGTRYHDVINYCTVLDGWFDKTVVRRVLERTFAHRQRVMKILLEETEATRA